MAEPKCKWLSDDFSQVCVNGNCPVCADFCPVTNFPEICKFAEFEGQKRTNGDKIRGMTDEELFHLFTDANGVFTCPSDGNCIYEDCSECWERWLQKEAEE